MRAGKVTGWAAAAAAALALIGSSAQATTYYISSSTGNDSWTGQAASPADGTGPWKTFARAATNYAAGDKILLKCGDTWNEVLRFKGSGTPENPIFIGAYGEGKKPLIDRQDYNQDRSGIQLNDQGGIKIVGIEFARCMTGIYAEYADECPTQKFLWIEDCYFHDALLYQHYEDYPKRKIGLGVCLFSFERENKIVLTDIMVKNCVFRRLASGFWTNSPDNFNANASNIYNFGNLTFDHCIFEEGYQWQMGLRGVAGGAVRNCISHDIGRNFKSFNGVAGAMFFRCKDWVFEDSEWGFIDMGHGSGDGEAFDFEGNCDNMTMRNCLFHDTDGPGFLLCCYASDPNPNKGILMENCVVNGKSKRPMRLPRCAIVNTTDWTQAIWKNCRFYLSPGEALMRVMDPEQNKKSQFIDCSVKNLKDACSSPKLAVAKITASSEGAGAEAAKAGDDSAESAWKSTAAADQWLELDFGKPVTVNEFKLREDPSSYIGQYRISYWDDKAQQWLSCFNGVNVKAEFVAPIVSRTTSKVRISFLKMNSGNPALRTFEAYNDPAGKAFNDPTGAAAVGVVGQ